MKPLELLKIAVSSIRANKVRSLLTMLGLIIGISSVVTILSIGSGTEASISTNLGSLGINNITISESRDETIMPDERIDRSDVQLIKEAFPDIVSAISPKVSEIASLRENIDDTKVILNGASADLDQIDNLDLIAGRFVDENDVLTKKKVIVIDSDIQTELFGSETAIGKLISLDSGPKTSSYTVIGVFKKEESSLLVSNSQMYVPHTTLDQVFNLKGRIEGIQISLVSNEQIGTDANRIIQFLERLHHNEDKGKYEYLSMSSMVSTVTDTLGMVTMLVSAVAGISLVVGGIGVMNIMLVSVTERTREIGVRKALGAKRKDILLQFLVEAVIICLIGGAIGITFGFIFTEIAEKAFNTPMSLSLFSVLLSTLFSTAMGIIFGVYPASKASKLDPIESLRYE